MSKLDLKGMTFGRLTVLENSGKKTRHWNVIWTCLCLCGKLVNISSKHLSR